MVLPRSSPSFFVVTLGRPRCTREARVISTPETEPEPEPTKTEDQPQGRKPELTDEELDRVSGGAAWVCPDPAPVTRKAIRKDASSTPEG